MKFLLVIIVFCGMGYVIYTQRAEKEALTNDLNSSREQLVELQKKYDALQRTQVRRPAATSMGGGTAVSSNPQQAAQPAESVPQSPQPAAGAWMQDPGHASPLGTPPPFRKNGLH
ncbi:MAG: hypothetical protein WCH43_14795 [Verrucomicrobiota bacterium]